MCRMLMYTRCILQLFFMKNGTIGIHIMWTRSQFPYNVSVYNGVGSHLMNRPLWLIMLISPITTKQFLYGEGSFFGTYICVISFPLHPRGVFVSDLILTCLLVSFSSSTFLNRTNIYIYGDGWLLNTALKFFKIVPIQHYFLTRF